MAKIRYGQKMCISCGACINFSKNWAEDNGKVKPLKKNVRGKEIEENRRAAEACPVDAIKVIE